jgi:acyl carrier protein
VATELEEKINKVICDKLGVTADKIVAEAKFVEDLGADSLDQVELVMALEDEFNLEIPDEDAEKLKSVAEVLAYVKSKQA